MAAAIALAVPAAASADVFGDLGGDPMTTEPTPTVTIVSNKDDYAPGALVTLTGSGWQAGESVAISVVDDGSGTGPWQYDTTVTADVDGNIVESFNLPETYSAMYYVTATGEHSGVATTSFADSLTDYRQGTAAGGASPDACSTPSNVLTSDNQRAKCIRTSSNPGQAVIAQGFNLQSVVPPGATNIQFNVEVEALRGTAGARGARIALSSDGGTTFTGGTNDTGAFGSQVVDETKTFPGAATTCNDFGRAWAYEDLDDTKFRVRAAVDGGATADAGMFIDIDRIRVRVCYDGTNLVHAAVAGRPTAVASPSETVPVQYLANIRSTGSPQWGSTSYQVEGASAVCDNHANHTGAGTFDHFSNATSPVAHGTYDVTVRAYENDTCTATQLAGSPIILTDALTVGIFGDSFGNDSVPNYAVKGWTDGGGDCTVEKMAAAVDFDAYLQVRQGCTQTRPGISTAGLENIHLKYRWGQQTNAADADGLKVEWKKTSDVSWTAVNTHALINTSDVITIPNSEDVALGATAANTSIDIRFTGQTGAAGVRALVDDVIVTGTPPSNDATFTVTKAYSPSGSGAVDVTLNCSDNDFDDDTKTASPGNPAVFNLSGFDTGMTCTATEDNAPAGYTGSYSGNCTNVTIADNGSYTCNITNTLNEATVQVDKNFSDSNGTASVDVTLTCDAPATVAAPNPTAATHGSNAEFTVKGFTNATYCDAAEDGEPGYTETASCVAFKPSAAGPGAECSITNTLNEATVQVDKNFSDSNGTASVDVTLTCDAPATVAAPNPTAATHGSNAEFTVKGFTNATYCDAAEDGEPGYTETASCVAFKPSAAGPGAECSITNTLNEATVQVDKNFSDSNGTASVDVTLTCDAPATVAAPNPTAATHGSNAEFTVKGFTNATYCDAAEDGEPGYTETASCVAFKPSAAGPGAECSITNTLNEATVQVDKNFSDSNGTASVDVTLTCDAPATVAAPNPTAATHGSNAEFTVKGFTNATYCDAAEDGEPGYTETASCVAFKPSAAGPGAECSITNTLNEATVQVDKNFSDSNGTASVDVTLTCDAPATVAAPNPTAATHGSNAEFTVKGFTNATYCDAAEDGEPGYTETASCVAFKPSAAGPGAECSITNTLNEATVQVDKNFSDSNGTASVDVTLTCDAPATVAAPNPTAATHGSNAEFTVKGFTNATYCDAAEDGEPGYTETASCVAFKPSAAGPGAECSITNTLNEATVQVDKNFSDSNGTASVDVTLTCDAPATVAAPNPTAATHGSNAEFTVKGFTNATYCDAAEDGEPGYTETASCVAFKPSAAGPGAECSITNTLNEATVQVDKNFSDSNGTASVDVTLTCDAPATVAAPNPTAATHGSNAEFTVKGFTNATYCDAAEDGEPGYTETASCVAFKPSAAGPGAECSITNTLNEATVQVDKNFSDSNGTASVDVTLTCDAPATVAAPNPTAATHGSNAEFTVKGFTNATYCDAAEDGEPGYTETASCVAFKPSAAGPGAECSITNTLNEATVQVDKNFSDSNGTASVDVTLTCDAPATVAAPNPTAATHGSNAEFTVKGFTNATYCDAAEDGEPGYTETASCVAFKPSAAGPGAECSITNTLNEATVQVDKNFSDSNGTASVDVTLTCDAPATVAAPNPTAATHGSNAEFTVKGFTNATYCDAAEDGEPGYTETASCVAFKPSAAGPGAECSITNTLNETTITVSKQYTGSVGSTPPVTVKIDCGTSSGAITPSSKQATATPGGPNAVFTIKGYNTGDKCTATEDPVPTGYAQDNSACIDMALGTTTSCTIKNVPALTLITAGGCTFDRDTSRPLRQFPLIFTPDGSAAGYKLNATNPGQFFMNASYGGAKDSLRIWIPYPFVTVGTNPVKVYSDVTTTNANKTCFAPSNLVRSQTDQIKWTWSGSGVNGFGDKKYIDVAVPPSLPPFVYVRVHLDYGLKGVAANCAKGTSSPTATCSSPYTGFTIAPYRTYPFSFTDTLITPTDTIEHYNEFKKNPGIGGLVTQTGTGTPVAGAGVKIYQGTTATGTPVADLTTDADGWYMWSYKYTGKATSFTVKVQVPASSPTYTAQQTVPLKSNGYLTVNFNNVP